MYRLRAFRPSDWSAVFELHAQAGNEFEIPQRLEEALVVEDEETGKVVGIQGCRQTRECYVWIDHKWKTAKLRWRVFQEMHEALRQELERKRIEDVHLFIKPRSNGEHSGFAKKLMKYVGWVPDTWRSYSRKVKRNG